MIIYKITNLINNKIYVGKDSKNNNLYYGSGKILKIAIKKYKKENFKKEVLQECLTKKELNKAEIYWIDKLNSRDRNIGYNIALGGEGQKSGTSLSNDTKQKISKSGKLSGYIEKYGIELGTQKYNEKITKQSNAQIERFKDPNEKAKVVNFGKKNGMYGKCHTDKSKNKNRESQLGKKHKPETIELYKETRKGENSSTAKLTELDVIEIRRLYKNKKYTKKELSFKYNVKQPAIYKIINYITWKHIS